jgi:hypothetical protein
MTPLRQKSEQKSAALLICTETGRLHCEGWEHSSVGDAVFVGRCPFDAHWGRGGIVSKEEDKLVDGKELLE